MQGFLAIVLHAHLPFVRHPEHADFLEEDWLYEAISETYLPLLEVFHRLAEEQVPFRLTLTLSPTLLAMLRDPLLISRYERRLEKLCELADKEVHRTLQDAALHPLARFYRAHFEGLRAAFVDRYRRDLVAGFARLADAGHLELITCGATHGFLPLMQQVPEAVHAQLAVAVRSHEAQLGRKPTGIWLPECGYYPGLDRLLAEAGLRFFFLDAHGLANARPRPLHGVYAPVFTPSGVAAFGRDPESSQQVWSSETGYPGDPVYREFYRDVGFDLPLDYVRPYVQPTGARKNTGIKYYRITGRTEHKALYDPAAARARAELHAGNFMFNRERQIEHLASRMGGRKPMVVAPYDAELFGHWWFEGPQFLEALIRKSAREQQTYALSTPVDYLRAHPENQRVEPPMSSWGERGDARMWLDEANDWIYRHLDHAARRMVALAKDFPAPDPLERRALDQAARELLLAQSSDWAFIMRTGTMVDYAVRRTKEHLLRVLRLDDQLRRHAVDGEWLAGVEARNNLFPELDHKVYLPRP